MRRRWYWKMYFILMAALTVGGVGLSFYHWNETASLDRLAEWASLPLYIVQLVGLLGFIYCRRIDLSMLCELVILATVLELGLAAYLMAGRTRRLFTDDLTCFFAI